MTRTRAWGSSTTGIATGVATILHQLGLLAAEKERRFTGIGPLRQPPWISRLGHVLAIGRRDEDLRALGSEHRGARGMIRVIVSQDQILHG
jgi:hypothetical protein